MMVDPTPLSWTELLGLLDSLPPTSVFRGLSSWSDLPTSLIRTTTSHGLRSLERRLLEDFRHYGLPFVGGEQASVGNAQTEEWHWMALAQHHGLPTRLLDWTFSPTVALHFATATVSATSGTLWWVDLPSANSAMAPEYKRWLKDDRVLRVGDLRDGIDDLDRRDPFAVFWEPPPIDTRIINQNALFSMMPGAATRLDDWLAASAVNHGRITLEPSLKAEIRAALDRMNVTERMLFPGLDGLAHWVARVHD